MPFSTTSLADWECLSFFLNNAFTTRIRQHNRVKFEFKSITFTVLSSTGRYQLFNYLYLLLVITTIHLQAEKIFITMGKCNFNAWPHTQTKVLDKTCKIIFRRKLHNKPSTFWKTLVHFFVDVFGLTWFF